MSIEKKERCWARECWNQKIIYEELIYENRKFHKQGMRNFHLLKYEIGKSLRMDLVVAYIMTYDFNFMNKFMYADS